MLSFRRHFIPPLIALPVTLAMPYVLFTDQGNAGIGGLLYNQLYTVLAWVTLFSGILLLSRRTWFAVGLASTIIGGLWMGAAIKYQFLGSQLVAPDLIVAALSAETLLEMGLLPTLLVGGYLLLLALSFALEQPTTRWGRKAFALGFASSAVLLAALNLPVFYIDLQWTTQYKQTLPIFVQSIWRTQLAEPTQPHDTSYCCFKADRQAETFTEAPDKKAQHHRDSGRIHLPPGTGVKFQTRWQVFPRCLPAQGTHCGWLHVGTRNRVPARGCATAVRQRLEIHQPIRPRTPRWQDCPPIGRTRL